MVELCLQFHILDYLFFQQVYAFCAPKIIGGVNAPTPVGDLGMNQMTQAIDLIDVSYEQVNSLCSTSNSLMCALSIICTC
jgi:riboflavin biosynthesis pyrimidine reductase